MCVTCMTHSGGGNAEATTRVAMLDGTHLYTCTVFTYTYMFYTYVHVCIHIYIAPIVS